MTELKIPAELKFLGGPLADGDPKSKCKEVSRTKMQLKFQQNYNFGGDPWVTETVSPSAKWSVELKCN